MQTFADFRRQFELAIERFLNGDASLWKSNVSREADGTIMGAWGDYERGWRDLSPRYDLGRRALPEQRRPRALRVPLDGRERRHCIRGRDRAQHRARRRAGATGGDEPSRHALFRREEGAWKLLHRHADPLMRKTAATEVLSR
jgi:hypothetical protein